MSSELTVISPKTLDEASKMASTLSAAHTLPQALQKQPADVLAIILTGAELGLAPMQAIRGLAIIKGKPVLSADAMGALVKRRRDICEYLTCPETTAQVATFETKRQGDPKPTRLSFTIQQAQLAGLTGGDNWRKYPDAMLRARALSGICRLVYPDLLLGVYDPDELAPETFSPPPERDVTPAPRPELRVEPIEDGEIVEPTPKPAPAAGKKAAQPQISAKDIRAAKPGPIADVRGGESEDAAKARLARAHRIWINAGKTKDQFAMWIGATLGGHKASKDWNDEDMSKLEAALAPQEPPADMPLPGGT